MNNLKWIYTLKLTNNKFYIGYTGDLQRRMYEHFGGNGALWTRTYNPEEIIHAEIERHKWHEDFNTLRMMKLYGINNVRGGRWCQVTDLSFVPKHYNDIDPLLSLEENIEKLGGISHDWKERPIKFDD